MIYDSLKGKGENKANLKFVICLFILFHLFLFFINFSTAKSITPSIEYTPTTKTECDNGVCTKTLHSNTQYVYEDNRWKDYTQARSLNGKGFEIVFLESDPSFPLEVIDFNATSIKVQLRKWSILNTDIPLRVLNSEDKVLRQTSERFNIFDLGSKERTVPINIGEKLKYGFASTTIQLQANESDNLNDAYIHQQFSNNNYGSNGFAPVIDYSSSDIHALYMFNISSLPVDVTIIKAYLNLYPTTNALGNQENFNLSTHEITLDNWTEETVTWNNAPPYNSTATDQQMYCGTGPTTGCDLITTNLNWSSWDITDIISRNVGEANVSIYVKAFGGHYVDSGDDIDLPLKEYPTDLGKRPILNITYTSDVDASPVSILSAPDNNANFNNSFVVSFEVNATDNSDLDNATIFIWNPDDSLNYSETKVYSGTSDSDTFTYNFTVDGLYTWNAAVYDNASQEDWDVNRTLNISDVVSEDTTPPYFTFIPANVSTDNATAVDVDFNATDETAFDNFKLNDTNYFSINSTGWITNTTYLDSGTYVLNVSINDSSNNLNSTWYQIVVTNTTIPASPVNATTTPICKFVKLGYYNIKSERVIREVDCRWKNTYLF